LQAAALFDTAGKSYLCEQLASGCGAAEKASPSKSVRVQNE
jgi:hypothetical protein